MAREVVMPRLGWSGETGKLVEWLKQDGDAVKAGEIICTVEGDKANVEVETMDSGILQIPPDSPPAGTEVPVGTLMAYIVEPGNPASPAALAARAGEPASDRRPAADPPAGATRWTAPPVTPADAMSAARAERLRQPPISPLARRLAREHGIGWASLTGSGRTGRIVAWDVRRAALEHTAPDGLLGAPAGEAPDVTPPVDLAGEPPPAAASNQGAVPEPMAETADARRRPLSTVRRITAARLRQSVATVVPVTLTTEADATELVKLREQISADVCDSDRPKPSYNDLLIRLVALALLDHPALNASLDGDELVQHTGVHIGIAVDTEHGLLVPVLRDAQAMSIQQIARASARLIQRAREGTLPANAMHGGTFTITNLGPYAIDAFTPIINLPECAILGVGRIRARPVVIDEATEQVAVRRMLALSLTFDHRLVDGALAARFLQQIKNYVERPTLWLVR